MKFIYTVTYELGTWEELKEKLAELDFGVGEIPDNKEKMEEFIFDLIEYGDYVADDFAQDWRAEGEIVKSA